MQPFPLVSIDARRHLVADPLRTRIGIGEARIDHAAGLPLRARRSAPASHAAPMPAPVRQWDTPVNDWDQQPRIHDAWQLRARTYGTDAPV
jgi:hypothetical protein